MSRDRLPRRERTQKCGHFPFDSQAWLQVPFGLRVEVPRRADHNEVCLCFVEGLTRLSDDPALSPQPSHFLTQASSQQIARLKIGVAPRGSVRQLY